MRFRLRELGLLLLVPLAAACGDDDDDNSAAVGPPPEGDPVVVPFECPEAAAAPGDHVVLVVDNGFDLSLPAFQGKILGCYQRVCDGPAPDDGGGGTPPADFNEAKQRFITELGQKDVSCRLQTGASLRKSSAFERIAPQKEAWNAAISGRTVTAGFPQLDDISRVIGGESSFLYHGTWVLSALAYQNPKAKFVVVNNESIRRPDQQPGCPTPAEFDREIALYRDPEVRAAYLASPYEQLGEQIDGLVRRFGVTVANRSFGFDPWPQMAAVCPGLDWQTYYAVSSELSTARTAALSDAGLFDDMSVLSLDAAGNEGAQLTTAADALNCGGGGQPDGFGPASATLLVGSYDPATLEHSDFSNYGACVDAYAPGEAIVVTGPEGWLSVVSGTSFAAPLTARAMTLEQPATAGGIGLRDALFAARGPDGDLPRTSFPAALFYRDQPSTTAAASALISPALRSPLPSPAARPPLRAPRRPGFAAPMPLRRPRLTRQASCASALQQGLELVGRGADFALDGLAVEQACERVGHLDGASDEGLDDRLELGRVRRGDEHPVRPCAARLGHASVGLGGGGGVRAPDEAQLAGVTLDAKPDGLVVDRLGRHLGRDRGGVGGEVAQALEVARVADVHCRGERRYARARLVAAGAQEVGHDGVGVGGEGDLADGRAGGACPDAGEGVAEVARGYDERGALALAGEELARGAGVVGGLG